MVCITSLLSLAPIWITAIVGLVLCRKKLARSHPAASARATLGWTLLIVYATVVPLVRVFLAISAAQSGDRTAYASWLALVNVIGTAVLLASVILLLLSILADRDRSQGF